MMTPYWLAGGGLALLFLGGEMLVSGAVGFAGKLGVSPLLIGLVVVGFGTSAPELMVSLGAALQGQPDIAVGNVVGSNIANILLVLGAATLIYPIHCQAKVVYRDGMAMLAASLMLVGLGITGHIAAWQGGLMLATLLSFIMYSYWTEKYRMAPSGELHQHEAEEFENASRPLWLNVIILGVGLAAIMGGASMLVDSATTIARAAGISEAVIGLTLVAIGTSLPELATSVIAALRKHTDVAIGNVLGSNMFNILSILGITALVTPIPINPEIMNDIWIMLGVAVILLPALLTGHRLSRTEAVFFLAAYAGYIGWLYDAFPPTANTLGL
jgi:cation:H+ antiporter